MNLLKSIAFILLSSILAVSTANAENDSKQQKNTQKSVQQKNKKDTKRDKNSKGNENLKLFNESVNIKISQANIVADDNNKQAYG